MKFDISILSGESRLMMDSPILEIHVTKLAQDGWKYTSNVEGQLYYYKENDIEYGIIDFYPWGTDEAEVLEQKQIEERATTLYRIEMKRVSAILEMH